MTVNEMIRYLTEPELDIPKGTLEMVAVALKAGEAMRDAIAEARSAGAAARAWDAATKEDV